MFWEMFDVTAFDSQRLSEVTFDESAWHACEFSVRHESTGHVLEVMSAGGRPPKIHDDGRVSVELRGTYAYVPPKKPVGLWLRLKRRLIHT